MNDDKRTRSPNWLLSEKELLLSLVKIHYNIIENKKTDGVSIKSKLACWKIISDQYNSRTTLACRTSDNLKAQWESLKKVARKQAAIKRKFLFQTGGGSPLPHIKEDPFLNRVLNLINTTSYGIVNKYESDPDSPLVVQDQKLLPTSTTNTQDILKPDGGSVNIQFIDVSMPQEDDPEGIESDEFMQKNWDEYMPQTLRTPLKHAVQIDNKKGTCREHEQPYNKITEARIELQEKNLAVEMERAKSLHDIELQIKKEKLKQEKIQTSILLIKRRKLLSLKKKQHQ